MRAATLASHKRPSRSRLSSSSPNKHSAACTSFTNSKTLWSNSKREFVLYIWLNRSRCASLRSTDHSYSCNMVLTWHGRKIKRFDRYMPCDADWFGDETSECANSNPRTALELGWVVRGRYWAASHRGSRPWTISKSSDQSSSVSNTIGAPWSEWRRVSPNLHFPFVSVMMTSHRLRDLQGLQWSNRQAWCHGLGRWRTSCSLFPV